MHGIKALPAEALYRACDLQALGFNDTSELEPLPETLGQQRALDAIEFGVAINHEGYNLYVMGSTGLGKHRLIREVLSQKKQVAPTPEDWCYVADFQDPHRPLARHLAAGRARGLRDDMRQLVEDLLNARLIASLQQREMLRPLSRDGVEQVIEQAARRAADP